jgi:hypothetical protein
VLILAYCSTHCNSTWSPFGEEVHHGDLPCLIQYQADMNKQQPKIEGEIELLKVLSAKQMPEKV